MQFLNKIEFLKSHKDTYRTTPFIQTKLSKELMKLCFKSLQYLHRSYRLQKTRPLKNLLVVNEKGCGRSPGIGDIAYVKDLLTEEIVSTTFRCSHFGRYHPKSSRYGWVRFRDFISY